MRFLVSISYDGSKFNGYQKQVHGNTVQDRLEEVLTNINAGNSVSVSASGRTDAGVHAFNQKVHFDLGVKITPVSLKKAMNSLLPDSIYVRDVIKVSDYIIDLGPEGGDDGGTIVATGTPEEIAKVKESYTGQFLKKIL